MTTPSTRASTAPSISPLRLDDLLGLEVFLDTVQLGSISAAARAHHLSQPSATERVRRLERRLGVELLRRGPGGSEPTAAGEAVAGWARGVVESIGHLAEGVAALRGPGEHRPLRIMASLTVAEYVVPAWLQAHRVAGGPSVELGVGNSVAVAAAVADGDVRLGFVETPRRFVGLRSAVVGGDRLVVVVAPSHPWAVRRRPLTPAELATAPLLLREPGSGTRDAFEAALAAAGHSHVAPAAVLASTTTLKAATAAGGGASVLSELAVAPELALGTLVSVPVTGLDLARDFRALWRPGGDDRDVQRFVRIAKTAARR
jgi:DNA-binding transcriptional LysR family regulator